MIVRARSGFVSFSNPRLAVCGMRYLLALSFVFAVSPSIANWDVTIFPEDSKVNPPGAAVIRYTTSSANDNLEFPDAIEELIEIGKLSELKYVTLHALVPTATFQTQLFVALRRRAPKQLDEALASSGNMHNPALEPLRMELEGAILTMPIVRDIDTALANVGFRISAASFEKLLLIQEEDDTEIQIMLWLSVQST